MGRFIARRMITLVGQVLLVATIVFLMLRLVPGDPARAILGETASEEQVANMRTKLGIDRPVWQQYFDWLGDAIRGDLGKSIISGRSITDDIMSRLGNSAELIAISVVISLIIAIPLGTIAALKRNQFPDIALSSIAMLGLSLPGFVVGTVLVLLFGLKWKILPQARFVEFGDDPVAHMKLLILPSITLAIGNAAVLLRMMRSSMLEVMRQDYVRTARAKGLTDRRVITSHTLRNAINPVVSLVGLEIATLLGGMVIVEQIFNWPGLSTLLMSGVLSRDYPVVQGVVLVIAIITIVVNVIVDITYAVLDPRIRLT
ncbi:MAG: ABC transporter permease [Thermomicrobiales bacterium]|nr:ABC transporter permease [Thermomicrobiales bacterium]MCO5219800.1 ABC transporter permease [Thermomicrobiales bacterium]MCO5224763.1 ABC transporter permease [Thermomicrobiales bacterium]MCO5228409.1 ABC transporter permease [Thermomicrobiales bacterium]